MAANSVFKSDEDASNPSKPVLTGSAVISAELLRTNSYSDATVIRRIEGVTGRRYKDAYDPVLEDTALKMRLEKDRVQQQLNSDPNLYASRIHGIHRPLMFRRKVLAAYCRSDNDCFAPGANDHFLNMMFACNKANKKATYTLLGSAEAVFETAIAHVARPSVYEIINCNMPCHGHADIDADVHTNEFLATDDARKEVLTNFLRELVAYCVKRFSSASITHEDVVFSLYTSQMTSQKQKISYHVLFKIRGHAFANNYVVGAFLRAFEIEMLKKYGSPDDEIEVRIDAENAFGEKLSRVVKRPKNPCYVYNAAKIPVFLLDFAIYSFDRNFRTLYSCKADEEMFRPKLLSGHAILNPAYGITDDRHVVFTTFTRETQAKKTLQPFLDSLVTNVSPNCALLECAMPSGRPACSTNNARAYWYLYDPVRYKMPASEPGSYSIQSRKSPSAGDYGTLKVVATPTHWADEKSASLQEKQNGGAGARLAREKLKIPSVNAGGSCSNSDDDDDNGDESITNLSDYIVQQTYKCMRSLYPCYHSVTGHASVERHIPYGEDAAILYSAESGQGQNSAEPVDHPVYDDAASFSMTIRRLDTTYCILKGAREHADKPQPVPHISNHPWVSVSLDTFKLYFKCYDSEGYCGMPFRDLPDRVKNASCANVDISVDIKKRIWKCLGYSPNKIEKLCRQAQTESAFHNFFSRVESSPQNSVASTPRSFKLFRASSVQKYQELHGLCNGRWLRFAEMEFVKRALFSASGVIKVEFECSGKEDAWDAFILEVCEQVSEASALQQSSIQFGTRDSQCIALLFVQVHRADFRCICCQRCQKPCNLMLRFMTYYEVHLFPVCVACEIEWDAIKYPTRHGVFEKLTQFQERASALLAQKVATCGQTIDKIIYFQ